MKRLIKRVVPVILVMVLCLNASGSAFAATESEASTYMLIGDPIVLNAEICRQIYYEYVGFYGDYSDVTNALTDVLTNSGMYTYSVAVSIASSLGSIYVTYVMDATYEGWQSGRGATLYVYDNTTPIIMAN